MKPLFLSKTVIVALCLIGKAAIDAYLAGGSWQSVIEAVLGVLVIIFRQMSEKKTYLFKKSAIAAADNGTLGLLDVGLVPPDKEVTKPDAPYPRR
jgi:hypothetical protein